MLCLLQVDAMKVGVKDFRKAYKNVNIDQIEVNTVHYCPSASSVFFIDVSSLCFCLIWFDFVLIFGPCPFTRPSLAFVCLFVVLWCCWFLCLLGFNWICSLLSFNWTCTVLWASGRLLTEGFSALEIHLLFSLFLLLWLLLLFVWIFRIYMIFYSFGILTLSVELSHFPGKAATQWPYSI